MFHLPPVLTHSFYDLIKKKLYFKGKSKTKKNLFYSNQSIMYEKSFITLLFELKKKRFINCYYEKSFNNLLLNENFLSLGFINVI